MVKVRIPTPLRPLTGGKGEVETQAADIQSMIDSLNGQFPGLKGRICDDAGEIRRFVNIYLNEEDIRFLAGKDTLIKDGDQISIVPAIAGGEEVCLGRLQGWVGKMGAVEFVLANSRAGGCDGAEEQPGTGNFFGGEQVLGLQADEPEKSSLSPLGRPC